MSARKSKQKLTIKPHMFQRCRHVPKETPLSQITGTAQLAKKIVEENNKKGKKRENK